MKIEIKNGLIVPTANFLYGLTLVRKQSRMRRHLITILNKKQEVYIEDKKNLLDEHAKKNDEGKAIIKNDGSYDILDKEAFAKDLKELNDEVIIIEGEDNREMIRTMKSVLKKLEDVEYEGSDSEVYDYLCDQFGVDDLEGGEN